MKTAVAWAHQVGRLMDDPMYAEAERIMLIRGDLMTHGLPSMDKAFGPAEALWLERKEELIHTPK